MQLVGAFVLALLVGAVPVGSQPARDRGFDDFKIAAGTLLSIELRTAAASDTSHPGDPIEGKLLVALSSGDTELVPAGAGVFGSVAATRGPDRESGPGRLELRFTVMEHPETRSKVPLRATTVVFEGERIKARRHGFPTTRLTDARVAPGTIVTVTLTEPFNVRIPKAGGGAQRPVD